nr:Ig-like domain-containing protein [Leptospira wolffii]
MYSANSEAEGTNMVIGSYRTRKKIQRGTAYIGIGLAALLLLVDCSGTEKGGGFMGSLISSLGIPLDSGGSIPSTNSSITYKETDQPATLPVDFGTSGPQALLNLASLEQVDRYKSLEIVFSEPMDRNSVFTSFSLKEKTGPSSFASLPGPSSPAAESKGGVFYWKSGGRLLFDPYRELKSNTTYQLSITSDAQGLEGGTLTAYTVEFTTEPDYYVTMSLNGKSVGPGNSVNDLTFADASPGTVAMNLTANFTNPVAGTTFIKSIKLKHMGSSEQYEVCNAPTTPCNMTNALATSLNLNGLSAGLKPFQGGNSYIFEITTSTGKVFQRSLGFNYGKVNGNPYNILTKGAATVLDEAQTLKLFGGVLERFAKGDFRIKDPADSTVKTFANFSNAPTTGTKRSGYCMNYDSFNFIRSYGDAGDYVSGASFQDGYCGPNGTGSNQGAFTGYGCPPLSDCMNFDVDVYITSVNIPTTVSASTTKDCNNNDVTNATENIKACLKVNGNGDLGVTLRGKSATIGLIVVARNQGDIGGFLCGLAGSCAGTLFSFSMTSDLNYNLSVKPVRTAKARTSSSVDGSGNFVIQIKNPFTPTDPDTGNFYVSEWATNLTTHDIVQRSSGSWLANLITSIGTDLANSMVTALAPKITQAMLGDVIQGVAPKALNSVVQSLKTPGLDITLPNYLPAPLASFPLSLQLQVESDAQVKMNGANKAVVGSADIALVTPAASRLTNASPNYHGQGGAVGFVSTRPIPASTALTSDYAFNNSSVNPGLLLTLTADTVTQAAFSLWQNGALNLRINRQFIDTIVAYAGTDPLFQLTQELVKVGTLMNVLSPGRPLLGLNPSDSTKIIRGVSSTDDVDIDVYAIHAPNGEFKWVGNTAQKPTLVVNFTDLELRIYGRRPNGTNVGTDVSPLACSSAAADTASNSCRYLLNKARVSIKADGIFDFVSFVNPTGNTTYDKLNALKLILNKDVDKMSYTLDILEGTDFNPFGLDPKGIFQVVDPLIRSLIVPLVNNVLRQVPLPRTLTISSLYHPSNNTTCNIKADTDNLTLKTFNVTPGSEPYPYLFGALQFQGTAASNPASTVVCP